MEPLLNIREIQKFTAGPTQPISTLQGINFKDRLIKAAEENRQFMKFITVDESLVNEKDATLRYARQTAHLAVADTPPDQTGTTATVRTLTRIDDVIEKIDIAIATANYHYGQIDITQEDYLTSKLDKFKIAKNIMKNDIGRKPDQAIATGLQSTSVTNVVYGGSGNTQVEDLANGDVFNEDVLADACTYIEDGDRIPIATFIHPWQANRIRKSANFRDASKLGDDRVNVRGWIGRYGQTEVIVSTNVPYYAATATDLNEAAAWGANGYCGFVLGAGSADEMPDDGPRGNLKFDKIAGTWAWKLKPTISDFVYEPKEAMFHIYSDWAGKFNCDTIGAICLMKTTKV